MGLIGTVGGAAPIIHPSAWIAPGAVLVGKVTLGQSASVWYGAVLRADEDEIVEVVASHYLDAYRLVAFLSLACVPLILFAGRAKPLSREAAAAADAH